MSSNSGGSQELGAHAEPFHYRSIGNGSGEGSIAAVVGSAIAWSAPGGEEEIDLQQREKQAFESGMQEGETRARAACEQQIAAVRASIGKALTEFGAQRDSYFNHVEPEIVQLALGIARKILHREAQMDPLLLTGMVHVALEKLDAGMRVRLRTNPADIHFWNECFSAPDSFQPSPELIGDPMLQRGECTLETELGSTHVSLETHLKEIEQGFFDLLDQRPRVR